MDDMKYNIACVTDVGTKKRVNQDCVFVREYCTGSNAAVFAVLCDGMGGLRHGEVASASIVADFMAWADHFLPKTWENPIGDQRIRAAWTEIIARQNQHIMELGRQGGFALGSTVVALLLTRARYYILNIGDSRAYEVGPTVRQLTTDHTVIEKELRLGNLTPEQAERAPIRSVLTRCVGTSPTVYPDLYFGNPLTRGTYVLCSDGFRHKIAMEEIGKYLWVEEWMQSDELQRRAEYLVELNKRRGETDNISVIGISVQ